MVHQDVGTGGLNEVQELVDEAEFEMKQNVDQFHKMKKKSVLFGEAIQLMHVKSRKFLSFQLGDRSTIGQTFDEYRFAQHMHSMSSL